MRERPRMQDVVGRVLSAPLVRLAHYDLRPRLPRLLKEAEAPPFLLLLHEAPEEVLEVVAQPWNDPLVHAEQLLLLRHRTKRAALLAAKRVKCV